MHAFFYTQPAQRRSFWAKEHAGQAAKAPQPVCLMQLTVDAGAVTALRQTVTRLCGDALQFMRIEACEHGTRMKVWLCIGRSLVGQVMEAVMRLLPGAEFGRFSTPGSRRVAGQGLQ
ncbi:hypothetical protein [Rugamonas rubra]|uniref:Uncharacterized protein n=1 Tax=Rugamonas rubra TaxID=758825 RepID=A0A1I4HU05_9BURK|nr:hypothetical protein [Rugamonas rubra]SFL45247.1 hypothetical protein SAMN02982985_00211 [Rugamonas rubra]